MRTMAKTLLLGVLSAAVPAGAEVTLLSEDFEGLTLKDATSPTETAAPAVWTDVPPAGWSRSQGATPAGNPAEFFGWTFVNKDWWVGTAGDQDRSLFTRGQGTVAVADPDEYDDGTNVDTGQFQAFLTSPPISLAGILPNTAKLAFDSSWRNEETQDGRLDVSFDGGATYITLLFYDSATMPDGSTALVDEHLNFNLTNPGGGTMLLRWSMLEGSNDWWWAIDNIVVTGVPEPTTLLLGVFWSGLASARLRGPRSRRRA